MEEFAVHLVCVFLRPCYTQCVDSAWAVKFVRLARLQAAAGRQTERGIKQMMKDKEWPKGRCQGSMLADSKPTHIHAHARTEGRFAVRQGEARGGERAGAKGLHHGRGGNPFLPAHLLHQGRLAGRQPSVLPRSAARPARRGTPPVLVDSVAFSLSFPFRGEGLREKFDAWQGGRGREGDGGRV